MICRVFLFAAGLYCMIQCGARADSPMPVVPSVSVARDASQEEMLRALHRDTGRLVLSEVPDLEHRSRNAAVNRPISEVIPAATADYHLHALVDPRKLLFARRFWDPREEPKVPIAEIQAIVADIHWILDALSPHFEGLRGSVERRAFFQSLTPEQLDAARSEKLTYTSLSPAQRGQWDLLTAEHAFNTQERELRKTLAYFKNWGRCDAYWSTAREMEIERKTLWFRYPFQTPDGSGRDQFEIFRDYPEAEAPAADSPSPSLEQLVPGVHAKTRCSKEHDQLEQPATLAEIAAAVAKENGVTVRIPTYARNRRYYLFSKGFTGEDVLQALAEINGWEVQAVGKGKYALDRPRLTAVREFSEFHRIVRSRMSPVVRVVMEAASGFDDPFRARSFRAWNLILDYLGQHHPPPSRFRIADLELEQQVRLANFLLEGRGLRAPMAYLINRKPAAWLADRERGVFRLRGETGPGKHPLLEFRVLREKNGERLTVDTWGWLVNSSTLGDR